ncbi:hypothetical protein HMN09_00050100 [Mycena chlorophos]|uniref:PhoD-like phosphatase metallophosphatase domain-containing protein n=1 Tax=Mycena chlorophos TaxID=658473 RepID=A0A8H6WPV6_MYCCL|nr:hypothetical protein HMN09_00050100 [Mycena chlorophos]
MPLEPLAAVHAAASLLFRLSSCLFLRVVPSPLALKALGVFALAYFTTIPFLPASNSTTPETRPYRAVALSLPSQLRANLALNGLLLLMVLEYIATPFLDPATNLSFSRVGAVSSSTAKISVRSLDAAQLLYREFRPEGTELSWKSGPTLSFSPEEDFVSTAKLSGLWPNTTYEYAVADVNRTVVSGPFAFQTFPDARLSTGSHFRFVASSCIQPAFPYLPFHGRKIKGFDQLAHYLFPEPETQAAPLAQFLLFLGDFIYSDVPVKIADDKDAYARLYRRNYQSPSFRKVYERLPIFHTYDDHEIENNFIGAGLDPAPYTNASAAYEIYNHNANFDAPKDQHYYSFTYADVAFFVMDTRRYRSGSEVEAPTMLGETQLAALHAWLSHANNTASFKFIVSSVPFTSLWGGDASSDSWAGYAAEKASILEALHSVPNVIIISGDRHEFASIEYASETLHPVHEYSTSPLNAFDIPFIRTLKKASDETVPRLQRVLSEEGEETTEVVQVPKERVLKYLARGNTKWSSFEVDTTNLTQPILRIELSIGGKVRYTEEIIGAPVKLQVSNAIGAFVTTGIREVFQKIGLGNPSRWF